MKKMSRYPSHLPEKGTSSLIGEYNCNYCSEACAQEGRFYVLVPNDKHTALDRKGSFCTPECAAAYNAYRSSGEREHIANRHVLLEREFCRTIVSAPPPMFLWRFNRKSGLQRQTWLADCRRNLTRADFEMVAKEQVVQHQVII